MEQITQAVPGSNSAALLQISSIVVDAEIQQRFEVNQKTVDEYAEHMLDGDEYPPIDVFDDGGAMVLADGFHRLAAAKKAGRQQIPAQVHQGDRRQALLFSVGANKSHGLRRSNVDKRRAVLTLLRDDEWSQWPDRKIARTAGVTHPFVAKLRRELSGNGYQVENEVALAMAERLGLADVEMPDLTKGASYAGVVHSNKFAFIGITPYGTDPSFYYMEMTTSEGGHETIQQIVTKKPVKHSVLGAYIARTLQVEGVLSSDVHWRQANLRAIETDAVTKVRTGQWLKHIEGGLS